MKNLYIVEEVLWDYTDGLVCIVADDLNECRKLFEEGFSDFRMKEYDKAIQDKKYKVLQVMNEEKSRIVSYVCGCG